MKSLNKQSDCSYRSIIYWIFLFTIKIPSIAFGQDFYILDNELTTLQFQKKNQTIFGIYLPSNRQKIKTNIGLSPAKNLYLSFGFLNEYEEYGLTDANRNTFHNTVKGNLFTSNIGFYKLKPINSNQDKIKYHNTSACIGYSKGSSELFLDEWYSKFVFDKIYFQASYNIIAKYWEAGIFVKGNRLRYKSGRVQAAIQYEHLMRKVRIFDEKSVFNTIEFKLQVRGKFRSVLIVGGISFENVLNSNPNYDFLEWGYYHLGLNFDLQKLFNFKSDS